VSKPRILLADDHTIVMQGLRALLEPEFQIVGTVADGRAAVKAAGTIKPDVVILDVSIPLLNGVDAAKQIRKVAPHAKIVFLTMHTEFAYVQACFEAGASAYVIKQSASEDLQHAIRTVLLGRTYITPSVTKNAVDYPVSRRASQPKKRRTELTVRQREILQLVAEGKSAKQAAAILNLSPRTVEFHKYRIMQQLGLETTAQLTQFAIKHKILPE
jgi:DNA-binding NarL/FixJ family response regulator